MFEELFLEETEEVKETSNAADIEKHIKDLISKAKSGKIKKKDISDFNLATKEVNIKDPKEMRRLARKVVLIIIKAILLLPAVSLPIFLILNPILGGLYRLLDADHEKEAIRINEECINEVKKALKEPNLTDKQIKQLNKIIKKLTKANKRIKRRGITTVMRGTKVYSENDMLSDDLYLECQDLLLEDETDLDVAEVVLAESIKDLFKRKKKKAEETEDPETAEEELNECIKTLLVNVVDYSEINSLCEDINSLLMESIICQDEEVFNEGIKDLFKKRKKAKDEEETEEETISEEIDTEELADDEDIEAVSESVDFEEFDPIVLTEDEVRLVPRGEKYLISESDFESVCFNYLGEKNGYQVLEAIAEAHDIESGDIVVMMSEGEIVNPKVKVNKGVNRKK